MAKTTRRAVLKGGLAGIAGAPLAGCADGGGDTGAVAGQIDHIVVVMMENRSFDHMLGGLTQEGRDDVDGLTGAESNPDAAGVAHVVFPFAEYCQEDPPHSWSSTHKQWNEGAMDGFVLQHESRVGAEQAAWVMGYYEREQVPVHYALADHFCVPDRYFCSVLGPTWPNRFYGQSGTSKGMTANDPHPDGYDQMTVYKAVQGAGREWNYFYTDLPFIGLLDDHWDTDRVLPIEDFFARAETGDLADFTWIDPGFNYNDDHPPHHVLLGQLFLGLIYEALAQSPAWERTLLVITYDEHGGFHDHVAPPEVQDDYEGFDRMGIRIPALIVGPWVKQGAEHTDFDHASLLKYVCERFDIAPWNTRVATANSLAAALDTERMASGVPLEPVVLPAFDVPEFDVPTGIPDECMYDTGGLFLSPTRGAQPELEAWVAQHLPKADRTERIPETHRQLMAYARKLGLLA